MSGDIYGSSGVATDDWVIDIQAVILVHCIYLIICVYTLINLGHEVVILGCTIYTYLHRNKIIQKHKQYINEALQAYSAAFSSLPLKFNTTCSTATLYPKTPNPTIIPAALSLKKL